MTIAASQLNLSGTCGVGLAYNFNSVRNIYREYSSPPSWYSPPGRDQLLEHQPPMGGAGWLCAGFTRYNASREAYEILAKRYNIVLQTPVRVNRNSSNKFFFCVYDTKPNDPRGKRPRWIGKSKGIPKPAVLVAWETMEKPAMIIDNSKHKWPFGA